MGNSGHNRLLSRRVDRRSFLKGSVTAAGLGLSTGLPAVRASAAGAPGFVRASEALVTHGVQSGDVTTNRGIVWARTDQDARMMVEVSASESFKRPRRFTGPRVTAATDFTGQYDLRGLPSGEDIIYRVWFEDDRGRRQISEAITGSFRTAPSTKQDISFVWSGDTAGQGWGINPAFGGMRIYEAMRQLNPDFFIHSGDTIYADGPIESSVTLPNGTIWQNITTEEKSKVAETLDEFRGNFRYNLLDENVRRFNAEVPMFAQWDDHETINNWYPGEILDDPRYSVTDVDLLATRARQAFQEYMPIRVPGADQAGRIYRKIEYGPLLDIFFVDMRTYRGPNSANLQPAINEESAVLGSAQLKWLKRELKTSRATWKVIASDMPIGLVVRDGDDFEAVANDDDGVALGRELEIADLLSFIKLREISNVVFVTADVHYTAAHYYDPNQASYQEFNPFWEFVSGPLNAGSFGPGELDATFGPTLMYQKFPPEPNAPPSAGYQFFGHVMIDGQSEQMTVQLRDLDNVVLYQVDLAPEAD